jgi:hypothetical protein
MQDQDLKSTVAELEAQEFQFRSYGTPDPNNLMTKESDV